MLTKYVPGIIGIILAIATIGGVAAAASNNTPRTVNDPTTATAVPYGTR